MTGESTSFFFFLIFDGFSEANPNSGPILHGLQDKMHSLHEGSKETIDAIDVLFTLIHTHDSQEVDDDR